MSYKKDWQQIPHDRHAPSPPDHGNLIFFMIFFCIKLSFKILLELNDITNHRLMESLHSYQITPVAGDEMKANIALGERPRL